MKIIYIIPIFLIGLIFVMTSHDAYGFVSIDWKYAGGVFVPQPASPGNSVPGDPYPALSISSGNIVNDSPISVQVNLSDEPQWSNGVIDTINVLVTSVDNPSGTIYTLTETDFNTGIFTGTNFVFFQNNYQFNIADVITVTVDDPSCIVDNTITQLDSTSGGPNTGVTVYSDTSGGSGLGLVLTETGIKTCEFSGKLRFSLTATDELTGTLKVSDGDILTIEDNIDSDYFNAQIIPTVNGKGSILANFDNPDFDHTPEVLVTYNGHMAGLDLNEDFSGGRGGGGLLKPGLVVDAVLSLFNFEGSHGSTAQAPPTLGLDMNQKRIVDGGFSFNGNPVDVNQFYTPYPLITTPVGQNNTIKLKIYEDRGLDNIAHVGLSYGLGKGEIFNEGRATIEYDRTFDGIESVTIFDPKHVLGSVNVTTTSTNCSILSKDMCLEVTFDHIFRESLDYNMVATNIWDFQRNGWQNYFNHGIEIVGASMNPPEEYSGIYEGNIYHLTSTGKNTAIDDFGYSWTFDKIWNRNYVKIEKPDHDILNPEKIQAIEHLGYDYSDGKKIFGFDRLDHRFKDGKNHQILIANDVMYTLCPKCSNEPYEEIDHTFSYSFTSKTNKLANPLIIKQMAIEEQKAKNYLDVFFEKIYPSKIND